jgi:hypothetical protein
MSPPVGKAARPAPARRPAGVVGAVAALQSSVGNAAIARSLQEAAHDRGACSGAPAGVRSAGSALLQRLAHNQLENYDALESRLTGKARKAASDESKWSNWAMIDCHVGGFGFEVIRHNAGMQSTHAEVECWRRVIDRVNELKPGIGLQWTDTAATINTRAGGFGVAGVFSERQPCDPCEGQLDGKFGNSTTPAYYLVPYKSVSEKGESAEVLRGHLETLFDKKLK